jgi:hypothetical protein
VSKLATKINPEEELNVEKTLSNFYIPENVNMKTRLNMRQLRALIRLEYRATLYERLFGKDYWLAKATRIICQTFMEKMISDKGLGRGEMVEVLKAEKAKEERLERVKDVLNL